MVGWRRLIGLAVYCAGISGVCAQTPLPVLGNIEGPYGAIQSTVKIGGVTWGAGQAAYGPLGTPLVLSGSNFGGGGSVQFIPYKNGVVDTSATAVQATVTLWTSNMLLLTVPSGALTGLVTVTVEGQTSNGLPFLVTSGAYAASCPAGPPSNQLQIITSSLHDGAVGQPYSAALEATGVTGSYSWSIASGTLPTGLSLSASGTISGTPTAATGTNPVPLTFRVVDSGSPQQANEALIGLTIQPQAMLSTSSIYSYTVNHDGVGNVTYIKDATYNNGPGIMGTWNMTVSGGGEGYDSLNRLTAASIMWPDGTQENQCWAYDSFGNRTAQSVQAAVCPSQESNLTPTETYNANNRIGSGFVVYDTAGNVTSDATTGNSYLYDGEGRVCAVKSEPFPGTWTMTGYLYDADGNRVAKGTITSMSCDPSQNGFQFTENYVLGLGGEELTMLDGSGNWQRTNIYAAGRLIGTYDLVSNPSTSSQQIPWLHFHLDDPLGTRRMQVSGMLGNLGQPEMDFQSLPFGDGLASYPDSYADQTIGDSTPLHFTGKEHDTESGNDYFGARYYSSSHARFLSPDWSAKVEPVPYATMADPQSLNLYAYVHNNPVTAVDPDGHMSNAEFSQLFMMGVAAQSSAWQEQQAEMEAQSQQTRDSDNNESTGLASTGFPEPAQQQSGPTLPQNPSGLGPDWKDVTPKGGTNPKIPKRFRGPKGTEIEFDPGVSGKAGWGGKDHWHEIGPDGKRVDGHLAPGAPIPGPDGVPEPEPAPQAPEPSNSPFSDWVHDQWQGFKNYLRDHPWGPNSSPGPYVPPLVPIPVPAIP